MQSVRASLKHANVVAEPLDAVSSDPVTVAGKHLVRLFIRRQPLPLQACSPVLEETLRVKGSSLVIPKRPKLYLSTWC